MSLAKDGAWCWFADPRAIYHNGKTYVGYITSTGDIKISCYVHSTKEITDFTLNPNFVVDDHNNPALLMRSDGRILAAWSAHGGSNMYYRISKKPEDISEWENINSFTEEAPYTYAHLLRLNNGETWLFFRGISGIHYRISTDDGSTWGTAVNVASESYFKVETDGTKIYFACNRGHPDHTVSTLHYMCYDSADQTWRKTNGTLIGAVMPFSVYDMELLSSERSWIWDIAVSGGKPIIVYVQFPVVSATDTFSIHNYHYSRWTGVEWLDYFVTDGGFLDVKAGSSGIPEPSYSGGIVLDHEDASMVYLSKKVGGGFEIFKYTTANGGETWVSLQLTTSGANKIYNMRPVVVKNHVADLQVLWMYGRYDHYTNYETSLRFYPTPTSIPIMAIIGVAGLTVAISYVIYVVTR